MLIFQTPTYLAPPLISVIVILMLLIVASPWSHRDYRTKLFCVFLASMALWNFTNFGMRFSPDIYQARLWEKALTVATLASFVVYYHFTLAYTNNQGQRRLLATVYLVLISFAALSWTDLFIKEMRVEYYGYTPIIGLGSYIVFPIVPLLILGGARNLLRYYRVSPSYAERNRMVYLTVAAAFPLIGIILDGFTNLPPAAIWTNLLFCILCSIAILKHHLLDISIVIHKSLVYIVMSVMVAIPYAALLVLVSQIFGSILQAWWLHAILVLFLAVLLRPLYDLVQKLVDKIFYRDRYDYLKALEQFSREAHSITNLRELSSNVVELVGGALRTSSSCLLLLSEEMHGFVLISCVGLESPPSRFVLRESSPLVKWLALNDGILYSRHFDIIPQLQSLSPKEKKELERIGVKLCVPIKTPQGQLSGFLVLGERLSQQSYSEEDERLLMAVSSQMAIALENARLYDTEKTMRKELEKQDEQKTQFLHSVAHELKTPLTAIISSSELLSDKSSVPHTLRERIINNVRQSALSMDRKVAELLNLAQMQIGELKIEPEPLEIGSIIPAAASQLRILFEKKEQTLTLEIPDSLPKVNADREKLEQVLFNLLSNANKFSPTGSDIVLRARESDRRIIVEVEDSAPAVTKGEKNKLFDPYYRGEDTDKREQFPGLGLGLAISRRLVELHHGEIWVESKPRKGNTFSFSLPVLDQGTNGIG